MFSKQYVYELENQYKSNKRFLSYITILNRKYKQTLEEYNYLLNVVKYNF